MVTEHLPPVGWADVATKRDLDHLKTELSARFDQVDSRFEATEQRLLAQFRAEMNSQTRLLFFGMMTAFVGLTGVILAAT